MVYLRKQKSLFVFVDVFYIIHQSMKNIRVIYLIKLICIDTFVKQNVWFKFFQNIFALCFKMSLAWDFPFWILLPIHGIPCYWPSDLSDLSFLSKIMSSFSLPYCIQNLLKFTQFSFPYTPGHLNTHVIIVNVYRSLGISKQPLSTNIPVCASIHVELIGQLSTYRLQYTNMYR